MSLNETLLQVQNGLGREDYPRLHWLERPIPNSEVEKKILKFDQKVKGVLVAGLILPADRKDWVPAAHKIKPFVDLFQEPSRGEEVGAPAMILHQEAQGSGRGVTEDP